MRGVGMLLAALAAPAAAVAEPVDAAAIAPFAARELAPGVHLLSTPADYFGPVIGNVTLIEQQDGVVAIDSGGLIADGRRVAAYVRSITRKPVKAVVITHWHGDHPSGVAAIRAAWPRARVISTARTRAHLLRIGEWKTRPDSARETVYINQLSGGIAFYRTRLSDPRIDAATRARAEAGLRNMTARMNDLAGTFYVLPTQTFTDRLVLDDPERPVELRFLGRANTDGDAVAWLPRQRFVVTGDIVVAPTPFGFFSFPGDWIGVIETIKAMDFALLVPGHGEPQADAAYLDKLVATLTDVRAQVGKLAREGLSLDEVRKRVDFSAQTAVFGTTPRNKALFDAYWLIPIVASAYKEALGKPIVQGEGDGST